jgi:hypothetical protein
MSKKFLSGINVTGTAILKTVVNAVEDTDKFLVLDSSGNVDFRTGTELLSDIDAVPVSRTITINGTTYDLSANRTWTIATNSGTVTSVSLSRSGDALTITGSPITSSGTINIGFSGSISQYIRGDGTLASFPSLTGFVPYTGATNDLNLGSRNLLANNLLINNAFLGFASIVASATQVVLTVNSVPTYIVTGSGGQTIKLPDATTLPNGANYVFNNNQSSGALLINNNSNTLVVSIPSGGYCTLELTDNSIAAGSWDRHFEAPSNVSWSTNTLDYVGSITGATWNGATVAINRGGTGATTASAALVNLGGVPTSRTLTINGTTYDLSADRAWTISANLNARTEYEFTTNGSSATYNAAYSVGQVDVFYNGSKLSSAEFTATNGTSVTLGFTPPSGQLIEVVAWETGGGVANGRTLTINGVAYDLSADRSWTIAGGVTSFNTRTGDITLTSGDVTSALGYTPANGSSYLPLTGGTVSNTTSVGNPNVLTIKNNTNTDNGYAYSTLALDTTLSGTMADIRLGSSTPLGIRIYAATSPLTATPAGAGFQLFTNSHPSFSGQVYFDSGANNNASLNFRTATSGGTITTRLKIEASGTIKLTMLTSNGFVKTSGSDGSLSIDTNTYLTSITSGNVITALGFTPVTNARTITINGTAFDLTADRSWTIATGISGSGTTNYIPKFTASGTIGNSFIYDTGTRIAIGGTDATYGVLTVQSDAGQFCIQSNTTPGKQLQIGYDHISNNSYLSSLNQGVAFTPLVLQPNGGVVLVGSATAVTGAGMLQVTGDVNITGAFKINGTAISSGGVSSFNTRTGAVSLTSGDVTGALGFTPYNSTNPSGYITSSGSISGSAATLSMSSATITSSSWAGGGAYHGYSYSGGNWRFGFSSNGGVVDVYADGNFYATDSSHLVLHAGNYTSYNNFSNLYATNYFESITGRAAANHGYASIFRNTQSAASNFIPYSFENEYGNHSWGIVARFRINVAAQDRPSIQFSAAGGDDRWNVGYCTATDWNFRITQNMAYRSDNITTDNWGTERFRINTDGATFCFSSFTASGNIVAYSDARIKTNVKPIENSLNKVLSLMGVTYNRTDLEDKSTQIGFIAQEVKEVLPEVVTYNEEFDKYGVSYGNITAILVEAIKEQQAQIEELKTIINGYTK